MFDRDGGVILGFVLFAFFLFLAFLGVLLGFLAFVFVLGAFLGTIFLLIGLFVAVQHPSQVRERQFAAGRLHFCVTCHVYSFVWY